MPPGPPRLRPVTDTASRRALAARLAPAYTALPGVAAVVISGSVARGLADGWSDLELGVYWHDIPDDAVRDRAIGALGAERTRRVGVVHDYGWFGVDNLVVGGFPVDVAMNTCDAIERCIHQVVDHRVVADDKHDLVGMIAEVVPLFGHERVVAWQRRLVLDDPLRAALVAHHLRLTPACALDLDVARNNDVRAVERTLSYVQGGLRALFALNGAWFVGFKAAYARIPTLARQPPRTVERLGVALRGPSAEAAAAIVGWVDEVYGLAEDVADVKRARERFREAGREPWTADAIARIR